MENFNFDVAKLNGPVVRLAGKFGTWQGEITVRGEIDGFHLTALHLTHSGIGKLPFAVDRLARQLWRNAIVEEWATEIIEQAKTSLAV